MSLRSLFIIMGLVTTAMIAAVIYFKVLTPHSERPLTVGEMRSMDRICYGRCENKAEEFASGTQDEAQLKARAQVCVLECQRQLSDGRYPP